jgi:hypothetical protein
MPLWSLPTAPYWFTLVDPTNSDGRVNYVSQAEALQGLAYGAFFTTCLFLAIRVG